MDYMATCLELLFDVKFDRNLTVKIANGSVMKVVVHGAVRLNRNIVIYEILYMPNYKSNLLSMTNWRLTKTVIKYLESRMYCFCGLNVLFLDHINQMMIGEGIGELHSINLPSNKKSLENSQANTLTKGRLTQLWKVSWGY